MEQTDRDVQQSTVYTGGKPGLQPSCPTVGERWQKLRHTHVVKCFVARKQIVLKNTKWKGVTFMRQSWGKNKITSYRLFDSNFKQSKGNATKCWCGYSCIIRLGVIFFLSYHSALPSFSKKRMNCIFHRKKDYPYPARIHSEMSCHNKIVCTIWSHLCKINIHTCIYPYTYSKEEIHQNINNNQARIMG